MGRHGGHRAGQTHEGADGTQVDETRQLTTYLVEDVPETADFCIQVAIQRDNGLRSSFVEMCTS